MPETIVGKDESATIQGMVGPVPVDYLTRCQLCVNCLLCCGISCENMHAVELGDALQTISGCLPVSVFFLQSSETGLVFGIRIMSKSEHDRLL